MPNWTCEDGSQGGPVCVRNGDGECGWTINNCPQGKKPPKPGSHPKVVATPKPNQSGYELHRCVPLPKIRAAKKWKVHSVCGPGSSYAATPENFVPKYPEKVLDLRDGTFVMKLDDGQCIRGVFEECHRKCLPAAARISTPDGSKAVSELNVGDAIWTKDREGRKVRGVVERIHEQANRGPHSLVTLILDDGRSVRVSAGHPDSLGRPIERLRPLDIYDGARVRSVRIEILPGLKTYDLLPSGDTGVYWADGIALGSTL